MHLYNKSDGKPLPDVGLAYKNREGNELGQEFKGTQADREVLASRLADELGMDHIPKAEITTIDGKEILLSKNVKEVYKDTYDKVLNKDEAYEELVVDRL
jgi:hypothetical protein